MFFIEIQICFTFIKLLDSKLFTPVTFSRFLRNKTYIVNHLTNENEREAEIKECFISNGTPYVSVKMHPTC